MKSATNKKKSVQQNRKYYKSPIFITTMIILAMVAGVLALSTLQKRTFGDDKTVTYLGEQAYGSSLPLSSMEPGFDYYYGTDLSAEDLTSFFKATSHESHAGTYDNQYILSSGGRITIMFYADKNDYYDSLPDWAKRTTKKNLFTIDSKDYPSLENSTQ